MSDANRKPLVDAAESEDPAHVWKLHAREPGDPGNSPAARRRTVRKGTSPHTGHARSQGVGRSHSTREAGEQRRSDRAMHGTAAAESVEGRGPTKGNAEQTVLVPDTEPGKRGIGLRGVRQDVCKVPRRRGQVHVFGRLFPSRLRLLAEKWTSPRTLQTSWVYEQSTVDCHRPKVRAV